MPDCRLTDDGFWCISRWFTHKFPWRPTVFNVEPDSLNARRKLRTTNMVEFQNKELKKRTRCIRVFPNKESLLRIATALLIELDEKWLANGKVYQKDWRQRFGEFTEKTLRSRRRLRFYRKFVTQTLKVNCQGKHTSLLFCLCVYFDKYQIRLKLFLSQKMTWIWDKEMIYYLLYETYI